MPRPQRESKKARKAAGPQGNGTTATAPAPEHGRGPGTGPDARPAREGTPQRNGGVAVCVPLANGVAVIRITSYLKDGKAVSKHYLLRCIGHMRYGLTSFQRDGGDTYVVQLGKVGFCGCDDHRRRKTHCKHMLAIQSLVEQHKL
jgi:hypothetical protein